MASTWAVPGLCFDTPVFDLPKIDLPKVLQSTYYISAVKSAKVSLSTITQPSPDLTQTGYNEYRI